MVRVWCVGLMYGKPNDLQRCWYPVTLTGGTLRTNSVQRSSQLYCLCRIGFVIPGFLLSHSLQTKQQRRRPQNNPYPHPPATPHRPPAWPMNKAALPPFPCSLFPACYTECVLLAELVIDVGLPLSLCAPDKDPDTHT